MKTRITLLCLWGVLAASAQDTIPTDLPEHLRSERSRLSLEKSQAATAYSDALKRCYQQIDVNSCKLKAQDIKIQADNKVRRQEIQLNKLERDQRTVDAQQRLSDKQSPESQAKEAERRDNAQQEQANTLKRNQDKNTEYVDKQSKAADNLRQREQHVQEVLERQQSHADKAAASDKAKADYQRKLQQAQDRRDQVMKDRAKRNPGVAPLPAPPVTLP